MDTDSSARRKLIEEIVRRWQSKHKEEMQNFADEVKELRQQKPYENLALFYRMTIPGDLYRQLEFGISSGDVRLFEAEGELAWFKNTFPEFLVPYDSTDTVR